jgi:hypothetical protein
MHEDYPVDYFQENVGQAFREYQRLELAQHRESYNVDTHHASIHEWILLQSV